MKTFFKIFFASLLALIVFTVIGLFILIGFISTATTSEVPVVGSKAVLVLDLSVNFKKQLEWKSILLGVIVKFWQERVVSKFFQYKSGIKFF